jgi:hypothetical protein
MHTVLDLFQHKTTSDIVFEYFWIKKWNFSLGPISGLIDPPPYDELLGLTLNRSNYTIV